MLTAGLGIWAAITIAVAGPVTSPEYLPVQVAQAEGYFAQEKLDVALKVERSEGEAARTLASGKADLAATSIDTAYGQGHVAGEPPLLLFGLTAAPPVAIVVSPSHRASIRSLAGNGPTTTTGRVETSTPLGPYVAVLALLPLALVLRRRGLLLATRTP